MIKEAIIEIPKGSNIKYEIENGRLKVDRILFGSMVYPQNYGFFENTLDWDGDPLDVIVFSDNSFIPGVAVDVKILGALKMIDGGEKDTKIIGVISKDIRFSEIKQLSDLSKNRLNELEDFFLNYKNLQNKKVKLDGYENAPYAFNVIEQTSELFKKYGKLKKEDFIEKMKKLYPENYD